MTGVQTCALPIYLCRRLDLRKANRRVLEALVKSGALDDLGPHRASILASLSTAVHYAEQCNLNTVSGQDDLFGLETTTPQKKSGYIQAEAWSDEERLAGEKETLGFYLRGHPIIRYENELANVITTRLKDIRPGSVVVAGYIHRLRTRTGTRGRMAEIVLDDRIGRAMLTVYAEKYQQYRPLLIKDKLIIVRGEVVTDDYLDSGYTIIAREIYDLDGVRNKYAALRLRLSSQQAGRESLVRISTALAGHRTGNCAVRIDYLDGPATCSLDMGEEWRVAMNDNLLESLRNILGQDNVVIEYN